MNDRITDERLVELIDHFNLGHQLTHGDDRWATSTAAALRELRVLRRAIGDDPAGWVAEEGRYLYPPPPFYESRLHRAIAAAEREQGGGA